MTDAAALEIARLDPDNQSDVDGVSDLHMEHLADSPVVQFGERFLRAFYYKSLVADGLVKCFLCRAEGKAVGFLSYTADPAGFMGAGLRRHFFRVGWLIGSSVLQKPSRLKDVVTVLRLMAQGGEGDEDPLDGCGSEVLSMATDRKFTKLVPPGATSRVPVRLFDEAAADLRSEGIHTTGMFVDPNNTSSNLFFNILGCDFKPVQRGGRKVHRYIYHLDRKASGVEGAT